MAQGFGILKANIYYNKCMFNNYRVSLTVTGDHVFMFYLQ